MGSGEWNRKRVHRSNVLKEEAGEFMSVTRQSLD